MENAAEDPERDERKKPSEVKRHPERFLPSSSVLRVMKAALEGNQKIQGEAKECIMECATEFIAFLASEAAEKVRAGKRKTVCSEDILAAISTLGFDYYQEPLEKYMKLHRKISIEEKAREEGEDIDKESQRAPPLPSTGPSLLPALFPGFPGHSFFLNQLQQNQGSAPPFPVPTPLPYYANQTGFAANPQMNESLFHIIASLQQSAPEAQSQQLQQLLQAQQFSQQPPQLSFPQINGFGGVFPAPQEPNRNEGDRQD